MSISAVVRNRWDSPDDLTRLLMMLINRPISLPENDPETAEYSGDGRHRWMCRLASRIISLASDVDHLENVRTAFYLLSTRDAMDLQLLQQWSEQIISLCDSLLNDESLESQWNLIQINECIEIQNCKNFIKQAMAYALNEDGIPSNSSESALNLEKALQCTTESIAQSLKINELIQRFNDKLERFENGDDEMEEEVGRLIDGGHLESRDKSSIEALCELGASICQKMNRFQEALDFINQGIDAATTAAMERYSGSMDTLQEIRAHSDDEEDANSDDDEVMVFLDEMDIDKELGLNAVNGDFVESDNAAKCKEHKEYEMDIELSEDIKRLQSIQEKEWNDLEGEDKLFVYVQRAIFPLISIRGATYGNLGKYQLAFYDEYWCTLMEPKDSSAWNNRGFAWYRLQRYPECIADCNYALYGLKEKDPFSRALLFGNRGLAEHKMGHYQRAVNDLNLCLRDCPQSRLAREALKEIWEEFTNAIYYGVSRIEVDSDCVETIDIPFVIAKIIADYGVGIDFDIIPQCHQSTIVYR